MTAEIFDYVWCANCSCLTLSEVPPDLSRYYPPGPYGLPNRDELVALAADEEFKVGLLGLMDVPDGGSIVEVGPGAGAFALASSVAGYRVLAIEMDPDSCAHLEEVVGVPAIESSNPAKALGALEASPDAVVLWHAIEHLPAPREVLAAAVEALAPGGALLVSTPNPQALQFKLLRGRWTHIDAPRHLQLVSLGLITRWLDELGMEREFVTTADPTGLACNQLGWRESVRRTPYSRSPSRLASEAGHALAVLMASAEARGLNGTTYTAAFRKARTS